MTDPKSMTLDDLIVAALIEAGLTSAICKTMGSGESIRIAELVAELCVRLALACHTQLT